MTTLPVRRDARRRNCNAVSADEQAFEIRGIGPHRTGPYTGLAILINCAKRHQEFLDTPASFEEVHDFPNEYLTFTLHVQNTNLLKPVFEESLLDLRRFLA